MIPARSTVILLAGLLLLDFAPLPASGAEIAGVVRKVSGTAAIHRGRKTFPAAPGLKLFPQDGLETGQDGRMGIILRDDSMLSLGPGSSLFLEKFQFAPAARRFGLVSRLSRGTLEYISGLIGKLSPESVRFDTPVSSIGVRGTHIIVKSTETEAAR